MNYYLAIHYVYTCFSHTKGFLNNARHMVLIGSHTMTKLGVCIYSTYIHREYINIHLSIESTGVSGIHITHKKLMFNATLLA